MNWTNPINNAQQIENVRLEVTPFVFKGRLYRLENMVRSADYEGKEVPQFCYHEDGFRIRDVADNRIISIPLLNHYFAIAYVWQNRVYVIAGDYEDRPAWHIRHTIMISSDNLISWTNPKIIMEAAGEEYLYNYALCRARGKFYLLYETDDNRWPIYTMRFCESDDLITWRKLPENYIYGKDKYTGGPALYYDEQEGWFYILYVNEFQNTQYDNRIARSRDLIVWQDASVNRPVVSPDQKRLIDGKKWPWVYESSASDLEMCEFNGQTYLYWINGNQLGATAEWEAVCNGPMNQFLRKFFE